MPSDYPAYLGLAILIVIAPGQDFAVVMKNCLMYGRAAGLMTSFGVVGSLLIQGLAAALGVAVLIVRSATAFNTLKVVGAIYLGYLGVQALRAALARPKGPQGGGRPDQGGQGGQGERTGDGRERRVRIRTFRQGLVSNITNPKVLAFYFSLLPQFLNHDNPAMPQVLLLASTHAFFALVWLLLVVLVLDRLRRILTRPRIRRAIEGVTGVALLGLGIQLINTQH